MTKQFEPGAMYLSFRNALARAISHIVPEAQKTRKTNRGGGS
ncbi:MAG: hypothetical protein OXI88_07180 [Gammaproteobacteria bacterium]|nr:hypothetical protein [Gammaproteobacteria bacterium]MDE0286483.1 hypothetical protein [Gammaproteobacteria bacterium]MDE0511547.1 hypothetical protein [Gammaproteobacteria bacterium]